MPCFEAEGSWNQSPLHMAAATGRADVVQQLLLAGMDACAWLACPELRLVAWHLPAFEAFRTRLLQDAGIWAVVLYRS